MSRLTHVDGATDPSFRRQADAMDMIHGLLLARTPLRRYMNQAKRGA